MSRKRSAIAPNPANISRSLAGARAKRSRTDIAPTSVKFADEEKDLLRRAAALRQRSLHAFLRDAALDAAAAVVVRAERVA